MARPVGIAGGQSKLSALKVVLKHKYINVLITDTQTACKLRET